MVVAAVLSSLRAGVCLRLWLEHKCNYRQGLVQASTQGKSKHRNRHREQGLSSRIRQEVAQGGKQVQTSLGAKKELSIIQKDNQ